jgi:hypothetical protein
MLADIAAGLAKLDDSHGIDGAHHKVALWRVEVVLFDESGTVLAVGPLMRALSWVVDELHHVQIREGKCFGPLCGHAHNEPEPNESEPE